MNFVESARYVVEFETRDLDGARYFIPAYAKHRPACRAFLKGKYYEPRTHELIAYLLNRRPGNIVHAGAFFGDMLPSFSASCGEAGTVYAFEPLLENYVLARLTVDHNRLSNVALFNSALGDRTAPCRVDNVSEPGVHAGGASTISQTGAASSATLTIDGLGVQQLSVLQLDVEGFEATVLSGARATMARCRPVILVEDNERNCDDLLRGAKYRSVGAIPNLNVWTPDEDEDLAAECEATVKSLSRKGFKVGAVLGALRAIGSRA